MALRRGGLVIFLLVRSVTFSTAAFAVGDAKHWDRPLDVNLKTAGDPFSNKNPAYQIAFYIQHSGVAGSKIGQQRRAVRGDLRDYRRTIQVDDHYSGPAIHDAEQADQGHETRHLG